MKWLHTYVKEGYELIGLGGLVGSDRAGVIKWVDECFHIVCPGPSNLPTVKLHGFGMTNFVYMRRWPWWSVDSASWTKIGAYGGILVPHKRGGKFDFSVNPYVLTFSDGHPSAKLDSKHYNSLKRAEKLIILEWLEVIKIPLGKSDDEGEVIEHGVTNRHSERKAANLLFFEMFCESLPKWPWPFRTERCGGFGL